jgi:hypothetical protein
VIPTPQISPPPDHLAKFATYIGLLLFFGSLATEFGLLMAREKQVHELNTKIVFVSVSGDREKDITRQENIIVAEIKKADDSWKQLEKSGHATDADAHQYISIQTANNGELESLLAQFDQQQGAITAVNDEIAVAKASYADSHIAVMGVAKVFCGVLFVGFIIGGLGIYGWINHQRLQTEYLRAQIAELKSKSAV